MADVQAGPSGGPTRFFRIWLIVESVVTGLGAAVWLAASAVAITAFGAPGTTVDFHAWAFVLTLWSYPVWGIAPLILAWMLRHRAAQLSRTLSMVPPAVALLAGAVFWH